MSKFYITTPIYYINDKPHVGHAYTTIVADVLARFHRLNGEDVYYLTGTDENSQKNVQAAQKAGEPDIKKYLDQMSAVWLETWKSMEMTNDDFIRTTEDRHSQGVVKFFNEVKARGDIYEGEYKGLYCQGCEAFVTEKELVDGKCQFHLASPLELKEKNYFFRASNYKEKILEHIKNNPEFIQPESRRNEVVSYINDHFGDVSISREYKSKDNIGGVTVGIPVPGDPSQALYVWFDALANYITAIGYGWDETKFKKYWPADLHLMAKDIIKFHCALWPAMLMSAGLALPKRVFAHGFFTMNGQKISKSLGNIVDPLDVIKEYNNDALRYFFLREITFGEDGDFSLVRLKERYSSDLANGIGNLARRILTMGINNQAGLKERSEFDSPACQQLAHEVAKTWEVYIQGMQEVQPSRSVEVLWQLFRKMDETIELTKPWEKIKSKPGEAIADIYGLLEALRHSAWMLLPIMFNTAESLGKALGIDLTKLNIPLSETKKWGGLVVRELQKGEVLFPRK